MDTLRVRVFAGVGKNKVFVHNSKIVVYTRALPQKGFANKAVVLALAQHFKVDESGFRIVAGHRKSQKTLEFQQKTSNLSNDHLLFKYLTKC